MKVNKVDKKNIPNSAFDIEYRTEWRDEVDFLAERGIYYTIRKKEGEYQIPVYKYTKTADLFIALADFYLRNKRNMKSLAKYNPNVKVEQPSFLNNDNTINEKYVVDKVDNKDVKPKPVKQFKPTAEQIEKARKVLEAAADNVAELKTETVEVEIPVTLEVEVKDDTE